MASEWTLSDNIVQVRGRTPKNEANGLFDANVLSIESVKEFITRLKKEMCFWVPKEERPLDCDCTHCKIIDKLAGDALI